MNLTKKSKFLSLVLRHKPEKIGITLDEHGWAKTEDILRGLQIDMECLEEIVRTDNKQRYSFHENKTLIRANQGHSIPVDVELPLKEPPERLFHGTGQKSAPMIEKEGLLPMGRLYVHLSKDVDTARKVGKRHGKPMVYQVDTKQMHRDGYSFYQSVNGVWLTKKVPPVYLLAVERE